MRSLAITAMGVKKLIGLENDNMKLRKTLQICLQWLQDRLTTDDEISDDDIDQMLSWSITSELAALPPNYSEHVPGFVASLIQRAKNLHPEMLPGAAERHSAGESNRIWDSGFGSN